MSDSSSKPEQTSPDNLARKWFLMTMLGVIAYVGVVLALMATAD